MLEHGAHEVVAPLRVQPAAAHHQSIGVILHGQLLAKALALAIGRDGLRMLRLVNGLSEPGSKDVIRGEVHKTGAHFTARGGHMSGHHGVEQERRVALLLCLIHGVVRGAVKDPVGLDALERGEHSRIIGGIHVGATKGVHGVTLGAKSL